MPFTKQQRKPRYRRVSTTKIRLQERDKEIINQVYKHRFLTSEHLTALVPGSQQVILRRLHLLFHAGYLSRPPEQIRPYQQGSNPIVYGLGNKGADLLALEFQIPRAKVDWTSKNRDVKRIYLEHSLMIAHFMVCLELACRQHPSLELIEPQEIISSLSAKSQNQANPLSWKVNLTRDWQGEKRKLNFSMVPDKVFGLYFPEDPPGRNRAFFFLEADRATMPVKRNNLYKSSYFKKMVGYWGSWSQGLYEKTLGFKNARVLTVTKSQERIQSMIEACKQVDERQKGSAMFLFAQANDFTLKNPGRILENAWQNGRDNQLVSLVD
jgi:hypothetical protein